MRDHGALIGSCGQGAWVVRRRGGMVGWLTHPRETEAAKAEAEEGKATAEGDLAMTEKALDDAKTALAEANADCMQVAADHEATVTGRTEELTALAQAKKVLEETSSGAVTQTYSFLQLKTRTDLASAELVSLVK